jgi:hypothetical protein
MPWTEIQATVQVPELEMQKQFKLYYYTTGDEELDKSLGCHKNIIYSGNEPFDKDFPKFNSWKPEPRSVIYKFVHGKLHINIYNNNNSVYFTNYSITKIPNVSMKKLVSIKDVFGSKDFVKEYKNGIFSITSKLEGGQSIIINVMYSDYMNLYTILIRKITLDRSNFTNEGFDYLCNIMNSPDEFNRIYETLSKLEIYTQLGETVLQGMRNFLNAVYIMNGRTYDTSESLLTSISEKLN